MLVDISLGIVFFSSASFLLRRISLKLPEIIMAPEETIREQLRKDRDRSRIYLFIVHFRTLWQERYFHNLFFNSAGKILQRLHILLLRLDNGVMYVLRKTRSGGAVQAHANGDYWKMLREEEREEAREEKHEEKKEDDIQSEIQGKNILSQLREDKPIITIVPERIEIVRNPYEELRLETVSAEPKKEPRRMRARKGTPKKLPRVRTRKSKKQEIPFA